MTFDCRTALPLPVAKAAIGSLGSAGWGRWRFACWHIGHAHRLLFNTAVVLSYTWCTSTYGSTRYVPGMIHVQTRVLVPGTGTVQAAHVQGGGGALYEAMIIDARAVPRHHSETMRNAHALLTNSSSIPVALVLPRERDYILLYS